MTLTEYREKNGLSIEDLARFLGFTNSKTGRILKTGHCVRLDDALVITTKTDGKVRLNELVNEVEAAA